MPLGFHLAFDKKIPLLMIRDKAKDHGTKKLIVEYLKFIWKYMITPTNTRRTAQYIIDKIIIYEKYKNDIF